MRMFDDLRGVVLFSLMSFCIVQPAFCGGNAPGDIIAKALDTAVALETPQLQPVKEQVQTSQVKPAEPAAVPPMTQLEPQAGAAPACAAGGTGPCRQFGYRCRAERVFEYNTSAINISFAYGQKGQSGDRKKLQPLHN